MLRLASRVSFVALLVGGIASVDAQPNPDAAPPAADAGSGSAAPVVTTVPAPTPVVTATPAAATPSPSGPSPMSSHVMSVLPDITLKGDNNGPAKATLGLTATLPYSQDADINVAAAFSTKTQDGVTQLLGIDSSGAHPADFGGEVSVAYVGLDPIASAFELQHRLAGQQWDACEAQCTSSAPPTSFCAVVHPELYTTPAGQAAVKKAQDTLASHGPRRRPLKRGDLLPPELLCEPQEKAWAEAIAKDPVTRDFRATSPALSASIAGRVGYTDYKWLGAGSTAGELARGEDRKWSWSVAARVMRRRGWKTGDGFLAVSRGFEASTTTAKWCTPVGNVPRPDKSGSDAAETCRESPFGAPTESTTLQAGGFFGYFDERHSTFRASIGPIAKITFPAQGKATFEAGGALPIYFNTNLMPDEKGVFKGIVRLTPRLVLTRDDDGKKAVQFLVSLELLTGRSMFPMASDLL